MKSLSNTNTLMGMLAILLFNVAIGFSQPKRLSEPKRISNIKTVDHFVTQSFDLYNKIYVYDSLTTAGVEIPSELEAEVVTRAEKNIDSLLEVLPDLFEDLTDDGAYLKKLKATANLNKSKKALKYCLKTVKGYAAGTKTEEDEE